MSKRKTLFIGLQVLAIAVFVGMALACQSTAPVAQNFERQNHSACGGPDYVFMGHLGNMSACSSACQAAGLGSPCMSEGNCFCK